MKHNPYHVLCAIHKKKNFDRHLNESEVDKYERIEAKNMFSKICYSTNKKEVDDCFSSLFQLKDIEFVNYVRRIQNDKNNFCKAFLQKCTLGYNTSSVAESINKIIKSDTRGKKMLLSEFRKNYNHALKRSSRNAQISDSKLLCPTAFPFPDIFQNVSKICVLEIFQNICISKEYIIAGNEGISYFVIHKKHEENKNIVDINDSYINC